MAEVGSVLASHAFASAGVAAPSTNLPGEDAAQNASMLADASGPGRLSHSFLCQQDCADKGFRLKALIH